jgi:Icc-related predicted phosphoesterase
MKILALSDMVDERVYSEDIRQNYGDSDIVVGCGDLPYHYLEYVVSTLNRPVLYVRGNHDDKPQETTDGRLVWEAEGCQLIDGRTTLQQDVLFMGLGGSIRYKPNAKHQYSEGQMRVRLANMMPRLLANRLRHGRYVDIVVAHSPPFGIHDGDDLAHRGFKTFLTLMTRFRPKLLLHGHIHEWRRDQTTRSIVGDTSVIGVFPVTTIEFNAATNAVA